MRRIEDILNSIIELIPQIEENKDIIFTPKSILSFLIYLPSNK
jgi:hypothetical protein